MNKLKTFFRKYLQTCECRQHMHACIVHPPPPNISRDVACEMWVWFLFLCVIFEFIPVFTMCLYNILPTFPYPIFYCFFSFLSSVFFFRLLLKCIVAFVAATILSFIVRKHAKMSFCQCKKKNKKQVVFSAFHFLFLHVHSLLNCIFSPFFLIFHSFAKVGDSGIFFPYFQVIFLRLPPSTIQRTRYMFFAHCSIWYTFVYNRIQCNIWKWIAWLHSVIFI